MEVAKIDWDDSKFEKDEIYEHINAPQWIDFHSPDDNDDVAWFCRPDCNHPKSVEDFFKQRTPQSKLLRSASVSEVLPLGDRNRRETALKKRGIPQPTIWAGKDLSGMRYNNVEDGENENPNISTTPNQKSRLIKESIKSSAEKNLVEIPLNKEETTPKLKTTLSARNLFAGKEILNQITEFCTELKKLATRAKERENVEKENTTEKSPVKKEETDDNSGVLRDRENEKKPLLEARKEKGEETEKSGAKEKLRRKKRNDETVNTPPISVNLKNTRHKGEVRSLQIRSNPPSPQCFSANRAPIKATPPKAFRPKPPQERGVFQELEESNKEEVKKEESVGKSGNNGSLVAEREGRTLDVFWFLKPCTLSS